MEDNSSEQRWLVTKDTPQRTNMKSLMFTQNKGGPFPKAYIVIIHIEKR